MNATLTFSGTPNEIAKVMEAVQKATAAMVVIPNANEPTAIDGPTRFVSPELMQLALNRHKLTPLTQKLLRTLYDTEEDARFVRRSTLRLALGNDGEIMEDPKLNGVLGKFGMRVKRTDGYVNGTSYFEYKRENDEWCYRLPDHLRGVVGKVLGDYDSRAGRAQSTGNGNDTEDQS